MASPIFPDIEAIMTILQGELPEGVYAEDRADNQDFDLRSYSSSELRTHAQMLADLYANLDLIYKDKFISTVTANGLAPWEVQLFGSPQDASIAFETRQNNLLSKRRAQGSISLPAIASVVSGFLTPLGIAFSILPYSGQSNGNSTGTWILKISALGFDTYLGGLDPIIGAQADYTALDCSFNYAAAGITPAQLLEIQSQAYTYEVRIYGNVDAATLMLLDMQLTALEPARSTHIIRNNALGPYDADVLDCGPFIGGSYIDTFDFSLFTLPPGTYDVFDFGGFT